jgi:deazaflavin-dependent oxidoreductase (nitroreductase family)
MAVDQQPRPEVSREDRTKFSSHGRPWLIVLKPNRRGKAFDRFLVRWTGFSLMTLEFALAGGKPYHREHLLLTTIGCRSGQLRETCLPYYQYEDALVVCGTKGGGPDDPYWTNNLRAEPRCWIRIKGRQVPATARVAEGDERDRVFEAVAAQHRDLRRYQGQTETYGRDVPLVLLTPTKPLLDGA